MMSQNLENLSVHVFALLKHLPQLRLQSFHQSCGAACGLFPWRSVGQKLLDSLAETWDFFFGDVLSMLQAIFHPVQVPAVPSQPAAPPPGGVCSDWSNGSWSWSFFLQGKEPSVRQLALLHFRNTIVLSVKLDDALSRPRARVPPSITQMLLVLQVH